MSETRPRFARLRRWVPDILMVIVILGGIHWYHTRDIPTTGNDPAPPLNLPAQAWRISVFPTCFMLDGEHRVWRRDQGYSTLLGIWLRTLELA